MEKDLWFLYCCVQMQQQSCASNMRKKVNEQRMSTNKCTTAILSATKVVTVET